VQYDLGACAVSLLFALLMMLVLSFLLGLKLARKVLMLVQVQFVLEKLALVVLMLVLVFMVELALIVLVLVLVLVLKRLTDSPTPSGPTFTVGTILIYKTRCGVCLFGIFPSCPEDLLPSRMMCWCAQVPRATSLPSSSRQTYTCDVGKGSSTSPVWGAGREGVLC
jgi:hypothetical protein